jgi:hypothetical protein
VRQLKLEAFISGNHGRRKILRRGAIWNSCQSVGIREIAHTSIVLPRKGQVF